MLKPPPPLMLSPSLFVLDERDLYRVCVAGEKKLPDVKPNEPVLMPEPHKVNFLFTMFADEWIIRSGHFAGGYFHSEAMFVLTNFGNFAIVELATGRGIIYHWSRSVGNISGAFTVWNLTRDNAAIVAAAKAIVQSVAPEAMTDV